MLAGVAICWVCKVDVFEILEKNAKLGDDSRLPLRRSLPEPFNTPIEKTRISSPLSCSLLPSKPTMILPDSWSLQRSMGLLPQMSSLLLTRHPPGVSTKRGLCETIMAHDQHCGTKLWLPLTLCTPIVRGGRLVLIFVRILRLWVFFALWPIAQTCSNMGYSHCE